MRPDQAGLAIAGLGLVIAGFFLTVILGGLHGAPQYQAQAAVIAGLARAQNSEIR